MDYQDCEKAFAMEIAKTINIIINNNRNLTESEKKELVASLSFAVAAHISGSSFGGTVGDEEVYPVLSFNLGEGDESKYLEGSSCLHEFIPDVLSKI